MLDDGGQVRWAVGLGCDVFVFWRIVLHVRELPALQGGDVQAFVDAVFAGLGQVAPAVEGLEVVAQQPVECAGGRGEHAAERAQVGKYIAEHSAVHQGAAFDAFAGYAVFYPLAAGFQGGVADLQRGMRAQAFDHPVQGDVGQAAVGIGAADIGVHAGKPYLFDDLPGWQRLVDRFFP